MLLYRRYVMAVESYVLYLMYGLYKGKNFGFILTKLFDKAYMFADLFDRFFFSFIEDYLVLLEQIAAFGVDGYDQRTELFHTAVPECLRHS